MIEEILECDWPRPARKTARLVPPSLAGFGHIGEIEYVDRFPQVTAMNASVKRDGEAWLGTDAGAASVQICENPWLDLHKSCESTYGRRPRPGRGGFVGGDCPQGLPP